MKNVNPFKKYIAAQLMKDTKPGHQVLEGKS